MLTLAVLGLLLVAAATWGWFALTAPLPSADEQALCEETTVSRGDVVRAEDVLVSVFNGSPRQGLASATMAQLTNRGFFAGETGNADRRLPAGSGIRIHADDPRDPAVRLVLAQFRGGRVVEGDALGPGVVVIMGQAYQEMGPPVRRVKVRQEATYCQATGVVVE